MAGRFFSNIFSSRPSSSTEQKSKAVVRPPWAEDSRATLPPDLLIEVDNSNPSLKVNRPWLILTPYIDKHEVCLVEPEQGQTWPLPLLNNIQGKVWCVGSKDGWLVVCYKLNILLLNPITGEQVQFPSFYPQPEIDGSNLPCVGKVILSAAPKAGTSRRSIIAMAIASGGNVAYAKVNDRKWTEVPTTPHYAVRDIVYHDGMLCVLSSGPIRDNKGKYRQSKLLMLNFNGSGPKFSYKDYIDLLQEGNINLVSSPTGDLLLVVGVQPDSDSWRNCTKFRVMAYRPGSGSLWLENEDFGGWSFFVDMLQCTMHPAGDDTAGLKGNSVYFARNFHSNNGVDVDVDVFDIRSNDTGLPSNLNLVNLQLTVPLWFRPSLSKGK